MNHPLMSIENLSGGYTNTKTDVIHRVSFNIYPQDFIGILGPNGSGKTTLFKLATKALQTRTGRVLFQNNDIKRMDLKALARQIAFVPQETIVDFPFTVNEMVLMGRIPHLGRTQRETKKDLQRVEEALRLTDTLGLKNKGINELSSGERQRVFIARALAQDPLLLLLDEPTSHLDIGHQIQILDLLKKLNHDSNLSVLIILHDLNLASEYCNRILLLKEGEIFSQGAPEDVLTYQNIEELFSSCVIVQKNPISSKPFVFPVSAMHKKNNQGPSS